MIRTICLLSVACVVVLASSVRSSAKDSPPSAPDAALIPFLNDQTIGVLSVDLTSDSSTKALRGVLGTPGFFGHPQFRQAMLQVLTIIAPDDDGARGEVKSTPVDEVKTIYLVAVWSNLLRLFTEKYDHDAFEDDRGSHQGRDLCRSWFLIVPGAKRVTIDELRLALPDPAGIHTGDVWACREINTCTVIAQQQLLDTVEHARPIPRPEITEALAVVKHHPLRMIAAAPPFFARAAGEILRSPAFGTDRPLGDFVAPIRWVAVADLTKGHESMEVMLRTADPQQAHDVAEFGRLVLPAAQNWLAEAKALGSDIELPDFEFPAPTVDRDRVRWAAMQTHP